MNSGAPPDWKGREAELKALEGAEAIFLDMPVVVRVCLVEVGCTAARMSARAVPLQTPGLSEVNRESLTFDASWDEFRATGRSWHAPHVPWHLYFGGEVIEGVRRFVLGIPPQTDRVDRYVAIASEITRLSGVRPSA